MKVGDSYVDEKGRVRVVLVIDEQREQVTFSVLGVGNFRRIYRHRRLDLFIRWVSDKRGLRIEN